MSISISEQHYDEVKGYYDLLMRCVTRSAKRGGYSNLFMAITLLVNWMRAYKQGADTFDAWYEKTGKAAFNFASWCEVTRFASVMFDEWLWWYEGDMCEPRDSWGGLNYFEYMTLQLARDYGEWSLEKFARALMAMRKAA